MEPPASPDHEPEPVGIITDEDEALTELSEKWIILELTHKVSKSASNEFWNLAITLMPKLFQNQQRKKKKIPQFQQLRKNLYAKHLPPIALEVACENEETGDLITLNTDSIPSANFPTSTHKQLYEVATLKVGGI